MSNTRLVPGKPVKESPIYKFLMGTAGIVLGSVVLWLLPYVLVPHPREFDGFVYLSAWMCGIPLAATIGFVAGLSVGARMDRERRQLATKVTEQHGPEVNRGPREDL